MKNKRIYILVIMVIILYFFQNKSYGIEPESNVIYDGIDVSSWQRDIDFGEVKNEGIEVVYMKASEGRTLRDPYFEQNYINAKANGLKVGFYHYVTARSVEDAIIQANFFASVISGKEPDCKLAMDFETFGDLSIDEINAIGLAFMREVERITGKGMVIYSNTYNARTKFEGEITNYLLWLAQWQVSSPSDNGKWDTWAGWQYTSKGQISGINGYVDRDKFTEAMFLDSVSPIPKPEEPTNPENTTTIIIQWGDTLSQLAIDYNTTVQELVQLNNIANPNLIYAGDTLIVPISGSQEGDNVSDETVYIVKRGDTLSQIALNFGTAVSAIAYRNNIKNVNLIYVGQILIIPGVGNKNYITYTIQWGDTLWGISRRFGVSVQYLARLNGIKNPNIIYAGQTIRIK